MIKSRVLICLSVFFSSISSYSQTNTISLDYGEHSVGFKHKWLSNYSQNSCGELEHTGSGKPMLLGVWYPGQSNRKTKTMTLRDYVEMTNLTGDAKLIERIKNFAFNSWLNYTLVEDYSDSTYETKLTAYEQSMNLACKAQYGTETIKGKFPVIIYHHGAGGTYDDNAQMCEFYASHGYIVISSSFLQCQNNVVFEAYDWNANVSDLHTILNYIHTIEYADHDNIGLIGHSMGCQMGYAAVAGHGSAYKCFVAMDPTWDGQTYDELYSDWGESSMLSYIKENRHNVTLPILHMATFRQNTGIPEDSAQVMNEAHKMQLPITDLLLHCERTQITTNPEFGHESFISQGGYDYLRMINSFTDPEEIAYVQLQIKQYNFVCNTTLGYLNKHLKPNHQTIADWGHYVKSVKWNETNAIVKIHSPKPTPLMTEEWEDILINQGIDTVSAVILKEIELIGYHQFSHEDLARAFFHKDKELSRQIVDHYASLWPDKWKGPYLKGVFAFNSGKPEEGHKFYDQALALSPPEWILEHLQNYSYYVW